MTDQESEIEIIKKRLLSIELRLMHLESLLSINKDEISRIQASQSQPVDPSPGSDTLNEEDKGLESQIGRFGLVWLGNIVLLIGITFLIEYIMSLGHQYLSFILGYGSAAIIFFFAYYLRKSNAYLAFMFNLNGQILLFYITLRLHFFSTNPILLNETISIIILLLLVIFQTYIAIRYKSQSFAALSIFFTLAIAMMSDSTHVMLPLLTLAAAGAVFYLFRYNWAQLLVGTIFLTYISYFLWLFGNPVMGHPMQLLTNHNFGFIYLFGLGTCFSLLPLSRKNDGNSDDFLTVAITVNGILFTLLLILVAVRFFSNDYVGLFAIVTLSCLIYSTILKLTGDWNFASAFYALYGFMAMSIALFGLVGLPKVFLLLSIQSLIVVSMALWFRNRLIVIMNSLLFLAVLIIYLSSSKSIDVINFSFALVSLLSARIINWKRSRLQIKTDFIRNLYLLEGFFMLLFALYHAVPRQFITLSWTMAALLYFLLSLILKNVKYRYMALGTMIFTAFYLFIVDMARIEVVYRVLAFLFLAIISIGISIYYTNRGKKSVK
jgi:hypothetical protein